MENTSWEEVFVLIRNDCFALYSNRELVQAIGQRILDKALADGFEEISKNWKSLFEETRNFFQGKASVRLEQLSDLELIEFHRQYSEKALKMWRVGIFVEPLDEVLPGKLREIIGKRVTEKTQINKYSTILSSETELTPVYGRNKELYEIACSLKEKNLELDSTEAKKLILGFIERHYFMVCSYSIFNKPKPEDIEEMLKEKMRKEKEETEKRLGQNKADKQKLMQELGFNPKEKEIVGLIGELNKIHEERKELFQRIIFVQGKFLKELSRRKGLPFELVAHLTDQDIEGFLANKLGEKELAERRKLCILAFEEGKEPVVLAGKKAEQTAKKLQGKFEEATEVEGMCASLGNVIGKACLQLKPDPSSFKEGAILVTTMTTPDFVPVMGKAAAIVTDEGGITCHAAIVARELGIPCVVGTRIATKVFKDGDLVEVRANHGLVRKLS